MRIAGTIGLLILIAAGSGCGNSAAKSQSTQVQATPPKQSSEKTSRREIPVLETVDEDEFPVSEPASLEPVISQPSKFRPPDRRPKHDDERLLAAGIQKFESKRLILYSDIDTDIAKTLPPIVDQLYDALAAYFGPLPPDEQNTEFQMTGYLIRDEALYRELGLLEGLPMLLHGKHLANRFWLREQQHDYFRRHLLLHECVHCYTTFVPGVIPPVWYMEGMAELFATHRLRRDGTAEFEIFPTDHDELSGWGRIAVIRTLCSEQKSLTIRGVYDLPHEAFFQPQAYAWSWGLCSFLNQHPRYQARFRQLGRRLTDGLFPQTFHELFAEDERDLTTEWTLFEHQIQPGYDFERATIDFRESPPLADGEKRLATIKADRGWQDAGISVKAGEQYEITAAGRFTLADDPKPWTSEPQGISIDYFQGAPLGRLMACLDQDIDDTEDRLVASPRLHIAPIGKQALWTAPANGRLLLRLNDAWNALDDNSGEAHVTIHHIRSDKE